MPAFTRSPAEATPGGRVLTRTVGRQPGLLQRCGDTVCPPGTCDHDDRLSLQRLGYGRPVSAIPPVVNRVLQSAGTPLDATTRTIMEPRLGHSFSQVRIHTDAAAAEAASAVNAFAFTVGRNVVFGANRYQPGTGEGRRLLAHELTHVIQQDGSTNSVSMASVTSEPADPDEREATDVAQSFDATSDAPVNPSPHVMRPGTNEDTSCPPRKPGEVGTSYTSAGHLHPDVVELGQGRLLVADFGVSWRHVHPEARLDPALNAWLRTFEADDTYRLSIVGYTDCHGPDWINIDLRQGRARAVASLLGPAARSRTSFVGMAGLGSYVNDNSTVANRARNRGAIIEFNQEINFPAETITTAPRHCGPDSTQWLVDQMNANKDHPVIRKSREVQWPNYVPIFNIGWNIGFLLDFRNLVRAGGPWDFKSNQQQWRSGGGRRCPSEPCDRTVTLCGRCFNYDVPGNIHYGWVGRMAGLRPWFLHNRAAAAQAGGVDDPRDVVAIDIGIDMAESGGSLCDHIAQVGTQLNMDKTTGCPACSTP